MYQLIVFLPLLGFLIAGVFGPWIGARGAEYVTCSLLGVCFVLSWIAFVMVAGGSDAHVAIGNWFTSGKLVTSWALRIDTLTAVMLVVVTTVSFLVHVYSIGYMSDDPSRPRFFAYLSLFTFAMLMLVTADNLVQLFFGWEGVGLMSYLLIGFWYDRPSANAAAIKAFVVNRVGDFGFSLGIFLTFYLTGSIAFDQVFAAAPGLVGKTVHFIGFNWDALTLACLLLFMGAMGKSAQFLLHTWLPDAMEGPTPVSALIHAATMVTAGVFMVARLSPLFELSPTALSVVTIVGATTAFFAATVGLVQNDIKKVIAYSTCSQLGYMFVGLGVGGYSLGIFHLFTHAFFKALLFLGAGSVITAMHHEQDMRAMGGLRREIPFTFWMMMVGTLSLTGVGVPFTSIGFAGFVSKDAIIEAAFASDRYGAIYGFLCTDIAAALTAFYSWRLMFMTFFGARGDWSASLPTAHGHDDHGHAAHAVHESPPVMLVPLAVLAVGAILAGTAFRHLFIGAGYETFWRQSLFLGPANHILEEMEHVSILVSLSPTLFMLAGFAAAYYMYLVDRAAPKRLADAFPALYRFLLNKWYFDELYDFLFVRPAFAIGRLFWKGGDGALIDGFGPDGVSARVLDIARNSVRLQTGYVYHYAFAMLLGVAALTTWYLFGGVTR
ncbi:MAG TPA: NADH-quinone oxidoreductase subunit L [Roseiarcus sp.]|nr:NADH-quinone oxidoreductase subunit L [Roseiarcus sp.]